MKKQIVIALLLMAGSLISNAVISGNIKSAKKSKSDSIDVINYSINLDIVHLSKKKISGYTRLTLLPHSNNTTTLALDLLKLSVDSVFVENVKIPGFSYNDTLIQIPLFSAINITDTTIVDVYYHGMPQMDASGWGGFYFSSDSTFAYNLGVGFAAEPHTYGRVWFPCVDNFTDRATYDCNITVKTGNMAVCGGTLLQTINNGNGTSTYKWRISNTIPTYLASVAVGNYTSVTTIHNAMNGPVPIKIFARSTDTNNVKASFINLPAVLDYYESKFGPYQWERVGFVGVPFNSGAMEHATNIAYPFYCMNGNLSYEDLMAHEFSHHWFGDLITCTTAEDMWINEGWASYCEPIYKEGIYGKSAYDAYTKSTHFMVLNKAHIDDGGYFPIYGIPSEITYGTTVYDKGADVIHTLRNYMGDSLFFPAVKDLLNTYQFKNISTSEFRDFLSTHSGINLTDFFNGWIYTAGFPQFSLDSLVYEGSGNNYRVYLRQKLHQKPAFVNSNKIEITFFSNTWQQYSETIEFSGQYGNQLVSLPFTPAKAFVDLYEKTSDATTDYYKVIKATGSYSFPNSYFTLNVINVPDSAFFRIEHNWVAPDPLKSPSSEIFRVSTKHYWKVDGILPNGFKAKGQFSFNRGTTGFENTLLPTPASTDSLVLLYRSGTNDDWHIVNFIKGGSSSVGALTTEDLQTGEYTMGIGKPGQSSISENTEAKDVLSIYPNPSKDFFTIKYKIPTNGILYITDSSNKIIDKITLNTYNEQITWTPKNKINTTYFFKIVCGNKTIASEKAIQIK